MSQIDYIEETLEAYSKDVVGFNRKYVIGIVCPYNADLFKSEPDDFELDEEKAALFRSYTMRLMFLATRTRPDLKLYTAQASTKMNCPCEKDFHKLRRCMMYLQSTKLKKMMI